MIWFTSDTHFSHARIIELCNRPFPGTAEMDQSIILNWNSMVHPDDTVYHLGDVALGTIAESLPLIGQLNGHIKLVPGNHDWVFSGMKERHRERFIPEYLKVFDEILDEVVFIDCIGEVALASHFPYDGDSHGNDRYSDKRPADLGHVLIHGHTHKNDVISRSKRNSLQIHVGMDAWGYRPVHEGEIRNIIQRHS